MGGAGTVKGRGGVICSVPLNEVIEEIRSNLRGEMILNAQRVAQERH